MTLPSLSVLLYTPAKLGATSRLVDVGTSLDAPAGQPSHGSYHMRRLAPSMRLLTWQREGARFDFSRTGGIRVWAGGHLTAAEGAPDGHPPSALPLEPDDVAYLEAYLLLQNRSWNDLNAAEGPSCHDADPR
ncbi:hydrogenase [Achromobacter sp. UMC46]|uniref:hydrogenase n=1 Tax=Achromobacter sp. UMC46 TaxID=1862319 RepID=UPI00160006B1|nr:hydrogenase [Achromobacter sp. UMC46]MBB1598277.1 hydrogenase [Achromobacter sp. UMC46]